jgi:hypothetical protein
MHSPEMKKPMLQAAMGFQLKALTSDLNKKGCGKISS